MKIRRTTVALLVVLSQLILNVPRIGAVPSWPYTVHGTVKVNGAPVPDGTVISAWINGVQIESTATFTVGEDSVYMMDVPGDDDFTEEIIEGGVEGDLVNFHIGDLIAGQTKTWSSGNPEVVNLTYTQPNLDPVITEGAQVFVSMTQNTELKPFALKLHATDGDAGDSLTWHIDTQGMNGEASVAGSGGEVTIDFAPEADFFGEDSFVVVVEDGHGGSDSIMVHVYVFKYILLLPVVWQP